MGLEGPGREGMHHLYPVYGVQLLLVPCTNVPKERAGTIYPEQILFYLEMRWYKCTATRVGGNRKKKLRPYRYTPM
jgi:hypothetical protein